MCAACGIIWRTSSSSSASDLDSEDEDVDAGQCSVCKNSLRASFFFVRIPLAVQIKLMFRDPEWAKAIRLPGPGPVGAKHGARRFQDKVYKTGFVSTHLQFRYLAVSLYTDGVNPFGNNYK